jgi:hypothetical protein
MMAGHAIARWRSTPNLSSELQPQPREAKKVEAGGIEPPSESGPPKVSTRLAHELILS